MRYKSFVILLMFLVLLGIAYAHPDTDPTVAIRAVDGRDFAVDEVDTGVTIKVTARDEGFNAGVSSIQLFEDDRLAERKECFFTLKCELEAGFYHPEKGTHTYTAQVIDAGSNRRTKSIKVKFLGNEQPPELAFPEKISVEEGSKMTVSIQANDRNNDVVAVEAKNLPKGAIFANRQFVWTPDFRQSGTYRVTFTATDSKNQKDSEVLTIKVVDRNLAPDVIFLDSDTRFVLYEGDKRKFEINIEDPDNKNPKIVWKLDGKTVSSSSTFTYKPDFDDAGNHALVASVTDGTFVRTNEWDILVLDMNRKPSISGIKDKEIELGDKISFTVRATDKDDDNISYFAEDLPSGASFNSKTRRFAWQTREGDQGIYFVTFRAYDDKGLFDADTAKIRVIQKIKTSHDKYHEFLKSLKKALDFSAKAEKPLPAQASQPASVCNVGYLCYVVTYL